MLLWTFPPAPAADEDQRLVARVAGGDEVALRTLYDRFGGKVMALALRVLAVPGEAEDVVQDVFVDIWAKASDFDGSRGSVAAWILSSARNRAIDRLRTRTATHRAVRAVRHDGGVQGDAPPAPDRAAESAEAAMRVGSALKVLPPEQRAVIELAFFDGLSQAEIAQRTGHPLGTIKGRARAALARLASVIAEGKGP